jgi:antitoxin VapB
MALHIVNQEADRLAREIAQLTNESLSVVVVQALREQAQHLRKAEGRGANLTQMHEIAARSARKCRGDRRSPEEIIGYDEHGLPS